MKSFTDKVAVVTGGASGIGYALAERLLAEGAKVVIADIEQAALDRALTTLSAGGAPVIGVRTDVSDPASLQDLADRTIEAFGKVNIVCNNAGVETGGSFLTIPEQAWRWVMDVNFFGVLNGCRIFLPLLQQQDEAHIVNTASVAAFNSGSATMTPYCASKFAVLGMTESLEIELRSGGSSVGVSLLAPGPVRTRMPDAERNRPSTVPAATEPGRVAVMERLAQASAESGLEPSYVADLVVDAIRENRFFVLTHPEMATAGVRKRLHWMETGEAPPARVPGT
ncbi:SDR family NAD(P)-dependent oxidoreductase [Georgenia sp. SYP-B2076]|uniref:SDR family NAD(P)-dependent oxidoreductase n=1 Tax=Georgenia sp. SYP-B2076 TaxID=2495881 RepID=UPI000F8F415E|nr:SDR family NAD(P)-dependent oxidoreductase [Georgenia sp. SYP-B2076]